MGMTTNGLSYWQAESKGIELLDLTIGDLLDQRAFLSSRNTVPPRLHPGEAEVVIIHNEHLPFSYTNPFARS
jgi:hypothetical protein